ncbi:MAG TPA: type II CAAX endopeptidase family protein [Polyangiaceae bacterium]|nr:type II CAAX endopeptidase family protein [Polyangiaceae bacterium]
MEQPQNAATPPPQSFDHRLSQIKAWTLVPTFYGPILAWAIIKHWLAVSTYVSLQVTDAITNAALLIWWIVLAAPRPYSVRGTMGRPLDVAGWRQVLVAFLAVYCLSWIELLSVNFRDLWRAASSGGSSTIHLTGADPANLLGLLFLVLVAPLVEELVFRRTLFRAWRERWNPVLALMASSALFGVLHPLKLSSFLAAVTFALLYTRTRSLWASVLAHSLGNGTVAVLGALHYFWASPQLVLNGAVAHGLFALVLLSGAGVWLHFVIKTWRTLGAPLSPDLPRAMSATSSTAHAEALRVGSQLG